MSMIEPLQKNSKKKMSPDQLEYMLKVLTNQVTQQQRLINKLLQDTEVKPRDPLPLKDMVNKFLAYSKVNHTAQTYSVNIPLARNLVKYFKPNTDMNLITIDLIEKYKEYRRDQGVKNSTINRSLACLKRMFNIALAEDLVEKNPFHRGRLMLKEEEVPRQVLSKLEINMLFRCPLFKYKRYAHYKPFCMIAVHTGMRLQEILRARKEHVNMDKRYIVIPKSKNFKCRYIPLSDDLYYFLKDWLPKCRSEYLIGRRLTVIKHGFHTVLRTSGITKHYTPHNLRHTFASILLEKGVDIKTIQELLGHSNIETTERYVHTKDETKINAVQKLNIA